MRTFSMLCLFLLAALCLGGCGPREVGEGFADDYSYNPGREPEDALRYPIDNHRLQQRLYMLNQPDRMVNTQQRQREMFLRYRGFKPDTPDPMEVPRQRSPFRE